MAKNSASAQNNKFYLMLILLVVAIIAITFLFYSLGQKTSEYQNLNSSYVQVTNNYGSLHSNYSLVSTALNTTKVKLANVSQKYNITEYNLTHRYVKALFNDTLISIPEPVYNYTSTTTSGGVYNYSFYAPYSGYLVFNATPSILNSNNYDNWVVYFSQEKPYSYSGQLSFDRYLSTYATIAPGQGITYIIPVKNGTNYMLIYNLNYTTPVGVFLNLKYVGYYSR